MKTIGKVFRVVLYFLWLIERKGQRQVSGARKAVNLTVPSCLLLCFLGRRRDMKGTRLRPWG